MNIFFYSRTCVTCANLMQIMKHANILQNFSMYCVDDNLDNLPPHIEKVPTLVVGELKRQFVEGEAFRWVESVKFMNQKHMMEMNKRIIMANMAKNAQLMGPHGYTDTEMGGFSDNFAFTDVDHAQAHSFFGYRTEGENTIFTAPEEQESNGNVKKIKDKDQHRMITDAENTRKEQDSLIKKIMKENQINAMIDDEKKKIQSMQYMTKSEQLKMMSKK